MSMAKVSIQKTKVWRAVVEYAAKRSNKPVVSIGKASIHKAIHTRLSMVETLIHRPIHKVEQALFEYDEKSWCTVCAVTKY